MAGKEVKKKVGDYVTLQRGNTYSGKLVGEPGPALLGLGSIEPGGGFRPDKYKTFGGECPAKITLRPGDLYVALKGATKDGSMVGSIAKLPENIPSGRLTQDTARLDFFEKDPEVANHLYWILRTPQYRQYCGGRVTGSASASFSREDFLSYPIPSITNTTNKLVNVFEAVETKIELNRRMNATMEAMARALFQCWFVNFAPVRAKLDGRQPVGLDKSTAGLFPARFQNSSVSPIPHGWTLEPVGEVVSCVGGTTPSTANPEFWEDGIHHWTTPKDFSSLQSPILIDTDRKITDAGVAQISSGLLPVGTLLLSSRAPVAINQGFIAMKCNERATNYFMLNWCQQNMAEIESRATGTTFAEISKSNFRPISVVLPSQELMKAFTEKVAPLYTQVTENLYESRTLAKLRDTLLPKLLSGEIVALKKK